MSVGLSWQMELSMLKYRISLWIDPIVELLKASQVSKIIQNIIILHDDLEPIWFI